jgi:hypothetical protein
MLLLKIKCANWKSAQCVLIELTRARNRFITENVNCTEVQVLNENI